MQQGAYPKQREHVTTTPVRFSAASHAVDLDAAVTLAVKRVGAHVRRSPAPTMALAGHTSLYDCPPAKNGGSSWKMPAPEKSAGMAPADVQSA